MKNHIALGLVLFGWITLLSCGNGNKAPGPIDGSWSTSAITCAGVPGNSAGAGIYIAAGNAMQINFSASTGSVVMKFGSCAITQSLGLTYGTNLVTLASAGNAVCAPSGCGGALCGAVIPFPSGAKFSFALASMKSMTLQTVPNETWCSNATPAQLEPTALSLVLP